MFTNRLLWLGASAGALSLRGSGCRNLALPGVYEQASTLFPALYPTSLLLNLTYTSGRGIECARSANKVIDVKPIALAYASHARETLQCAPSCESGEVNFEIKGNDWSNCAALLETASRYAVEGADPFKN